MLMQINTTSCTLLLLDFSLTVKATTLIFTSECGLAISSAKEGKAGFIYDMVKSYRANLRAFHENPNRIHTELTLLTLKAHNYKIYVLSSTKLFEAP